MSSSAYSCGFYLLSAYWLFAYCLLVVPRGIPHPPSSTLHQYTVIISHLHQSLISVNNFLVATTLSPSFPAEMNTFFLSDRILPASLSLSSALSCSKIVGELDLFNVSGSYEIDLRGTVNDQIGCLSSKPSRAKLLVYRPGSKYMD